MTYYKTNELYHHGILGQKWGVRRYQNDDGTLTEAGKKRYAQNLATQSPDDVRRNIQKAVNYARGQQHGTTNRWMSGLPIGQKSKIVRDKMQDQFNAWQNSEEYKNAEKNTRKADRLYDSGKISVDEYDRLYEQAWKNASKNRPASNSYKVVASGRKYTNNYVNTVGKELTMAYLSDLGFDDSTASQIESIIRKSGKQTID